MKNPGFYLRVRLPDYVQVMERLSQLFRSKNWNHGEMIRVYDAVRTFIRQEYYIRKGKAKDEVKKK